MKDPSDLSMMGLLRSENDGRPIQDLQSISEDYEGDDVAGFACEYNENNAPDHEAVPAYLKINGCGYDGGFRVIPAD